MTIILLCLMAVMMQGQRLQQKLERSVVAVNRSGSSIRNVTSTAGTGSLISWRKLAQEPEGTTYNVYKRAKGATDYTKINAQPLKVTCLQTTLTNNTEYAVTAITPDGVEGEKSNPFLYKTQAYPNVWFNFNFDNNVIKRDDYRTKYCWPMDLDGNGEYDAVVVDRLFSGATGGDDAENAEDNTATTTHKIQAYKLDGTLLWTVDMGPNVNICAGQNDMVVAWDINCDGRCEVIVRSSDGTRFWDKANETWGKYVGGRDDADTDNDGIVDYRTQTKRNPPVYMSVIDGATGEELTYSELQYAWVTDGSDHYGRDNRSSYMNFGYGAMEGHFGIAYLDGIHPSLIMECADRESGGLHHVYVHSWDYDWSSGTAANWHHSHTWSANDKRPGCAEFHQIRVLDGDGDGCDEMWTGGYGVNPAQNRFVATGLGHGDRFIISDIDPDRPGLEGFAIQQSALLGQCLYDTKTAERIKEWYLPSVYDVGRGACLDIDATHKGYEILSYADEFVYDCKGEKTGQTRSGSMYEGVWWDGRLQREWLNSPGGSGWGTNVMITRVLGDRLCEFSQESSWATHGGTGTRPAFMGDITGDWREEIILAKQNESGSTGLVGYTTNIPTTYSIYCLQQDPHYRLDCTTRGYYQHPNTGFYLGGGMPLPPLPPVFEADVRNEMANGKSVMFDLQGDNQSPITVNHEPTVLYLMNPSGHDYTFGGAGTKGTGRLVKSMQGKATFNCSLNHTGTNLISEGTLSVNGEIAGPVELRARGTLGGSVTLKDTITFEGALNYEGCRLMPETLMTSKKSMTLPGNVYIEVVPGNKLFVEGDLTFKNTNYISVNLSSNDAAEYVIAECTGTLTCDPSKLETRGLDGINYDLVVKDNKLVLVINVTRAPAQNVVWTGNESKVWDYKAKNFSLNGATSFVAGDQVVFNAQSTEKVVTLNESMVTSGVIFDSGKYTFSGEGGISGEGDVTVNRDADVTLNMKYNDYTGKTIINGGTLTVPNFYDGGQKSAIGASTAAEGNLQINGGTLVLQKDNMATDHIVTLTDTATIRVATSNSALTLKGQVKGTGYLVKDGPGRINFNYGGANNFAGVIVKNGAIAQGAWNTSFGRVGGPMVLAGGEVDLIDNNSSSTLPTFNYVCTVQDGTANTIVGTRRGKINGTFKGTGNLTIRTIYVRCDVGANFSQFEGQLTAVGDGGNFRLMSNVTDMSKARLVVGANTYVSHTVSGGSGEATATLKIGTLAGTATDGVLGGSQSTYQIGFRNEDSSFSGLFTAKSIVKVGSGKLTLRTAGHTSPINVSAGTLELLNTSSNVLCSGQVTIAKDAVLTGTATVQNVTMQQGATYLCTLAAVSNTRLTVKGNLKHNGDTLLVRIPSTRKLNAGDELTVFNVTGQHTGDVIVKSEAADGTAYTFDTSKLLSDGKLVVTGTVTGIGATMSADALVDVFTTDGVQVCSNIRYADALRSLPAGIYIIGRRVNGGVMENVRITKR